MTATPMTNEVSIRVVTRMRHLRKQRGWSGQRLAAEMSAIGYCLTQSMVANQETRPRVNRISADQLCGLSAVFGVSLDDLVAEHHCEVCDGTPPPRFTCTECGKTGEETVLARRKRLSDELQAAWPDRALPTNEWLRNAIDDTHIGETE